MIETDRNRGNQDFQIMMDTEMLLEYGSEIGKSITKATATAVVMFYCHVGWNIVMERVLMDFLWISSYVVHGCGMTDRIGSVEVKISVLDKK